VFPGLEQFQLAFGVNDSLVSKTIRLKSLANSAFKLSPFELALNSPFELPPTGLQFFVENCGSKVNNEPFGVEVLRVFS
jgi:hypothetical protein